MLALVEGLPDDSRTAAAMAGGNQFRGWDLHARILADLVDSVQAVMVAAGNWKKHPPKVKPYPRPASRKKKATTIADIKARFG